MITEKQSETELVSKEKAREEKTENDNEEASDVIDSERYGVKKILWQK